MRITGARAEFAQGRSYFLSKAQLQKHLGDNWEKTLMEKMRVVVMKRKGLWSGIWELEPKGVRPFRGNSRLDCPDCWGQKAVSLAAAVDIRDEVEAILKEAHASDENRQRTPRKRHVRPVRPKAPKAS